MKKIILLMALLGSVITQAQVAVGTSTASMNASAQLEVTSNTKGFLPPRLTQAQRNAIASPAQGLMVYCTDCGTTGQAQVYNGSAWNNIVGGSALGPGITVPTVSTTAVSAITNTSFTSGGTVSATGGAPILTQGICYSSHTNTTLADGGVFSGSTSSTFINFVGLLSPLTTYYTRAYATNVAGTAYGNEVSFRTIVNIGDSYGGGIVAYILLPTDAGYDPNTPHGLIFSGANMIADWGCDEQIINGANATQYGSGRQNTLDILAGCSAANIAARKCDNYTKTVNGTVYDDWFLPSKDELNKLFENRFLIGLSSFTFIAWSSSEYTGDAYYESTRAWYQDFSINVNNFGWYSWRKSTYETVFPVRYF